MSGSKRISELTVTTTLSANDRVVVLTNPASSAQTQTTTITSLTNNLRYANTTVSGVIKVGNNLSINATGFLNSSAANTTVSGVIKVGNNLSINATGFLNAGGNIPITGQENGYVLSWSNTENNQIWNAFGSPYNFTLIEQPNTTYIASRDDYILFVDPGAFANSIKVILPNNPVIGKSYQIKNINPSDGYEVTVLVAGNTGVLENPITGQFQNTYDIVQRGDAQEWIWDGTYYRHLGSQTNIPFFSAESNTFTQIVLQNRSSGTNASGDVVVYNDTGNPEAGTGPFIDMGINSSQYSNTLYSIGGPSDAYLFNDGGDFAIGTATANSNLVLHAGGTTSNTAKMVINSTSIAVNTSTAFILPLATKANNSPGVAGQISWDANNIYVCVATNTWKKVSISDFS